MRFAFADPPYLDCAVKFYSDHPEAAVYDTIEGHRQLVDRLVDEYPDGWAYCLTSSSLQRLLPIFPSDVRVGAWVKPFHIYKRGVRPAYAWEPVIYRGGRNPSAGFSHQPPAKGAEATTPKDFVIANITLRKGLPGAKPERFNRWILDLLGFDPAADVIDDLFPGTGGMSDALDRPTLDFGASA